MGIDDWVVILDTEFTKPHAGKIGKIVQLTGDGQRYSVDFHDYGPIVWFHYSQIEPYQFQL